VGLRSLEKWDYLKGEPLFEGIRNRGALVRWAQQEKNELGRSEGGCLAVCRKAINYQACVAKSAIAAREPLYWEPANDTLNIPGVSNDESVGGPGAQIFRGQSVGRPGAPWHVGNGNLPDIIWGDDWGSRQH